MHYVTIRYTVRKLHLANRLVPCVCCFVDLKCPISHFISLETRQKDTVWGGYRPELWYAHLCELMGLCPHWDSGQHPWSYGQRGAAFPWSWKHC